jgi:hypothetical protein
MRWRRKRKPSYVIVRPGDTLIATNLHSIGVETTIDPQRVADLCGALKEFMGLSNFVAIGEDAQGDAIEAMLNHEGHEHGAGHSHKAGEPHVH